MTTHKFMLTKYECARIVGTRATQLSMNAPVQVAVSHVLNSNYLYIATKELMEGKLDAYVQRPLPIGRYYRVHLRDMDLPDDLTFLNEMLSVQC